jgi:hypothetical protein
MFMSSACPWIVFYQSPEGLYLRDETPSSVYKILEPLTIFLQVPNSGYFRVY